MDGTLQLTLFLFIGLILTNLFSWNIPYLPLVPDSPVVFRAFAGLARLTELSAAMEFVV